MSGFTSDEELWRELDTRSLEDADDLLPGYVMELLILRLEHVPFDRAAFVARFANRYDSELLDSAILMLRVVILLGGWPGADRPLESALELAHEIRDAYPRLGIA